MTSNHYEYGEVHDDDHDDDEEVELVSGGRSSSSRRRVPPSHHSSGGRRRTLGEGGTSSCKITGYTTWIMIIILIFGISLVGVYNLGVKEGKKAEKITMEGGGSSGQQQQQLDGDTKKKKIFHQKNKISSSFSLDKVKATRKSALNLIHTLEEYYGGKDQADKMMLQSSFLIEWDFDNYYSDSTTSNIENDEEVVKRRNVVTKLVDTMVRALVTDDQKEFIIGTIGSSVAAGHDNCNYDSYERQMERTFGPVWKAAGMDLICQNAGEGGGCGDSHDNQVFCIKQNVSPNIDIAHYTWTYFEAGANNKKIEVRESLARWAQMLPHQPPVHVFNTGKIPGDHRENELAAHLNAKHNNSDTMFGYNAFYMTSGYYGGGFDYDAAKKETDEDYFGWGHVGDGYHNVTRYGENETGERKESLGVVMRNWHPGPLAFQFTADTFSYIYSKAIILALDLIESDLKKGIDPAEKWAASKRKIHIKSSLPAPKFCDPLYCVVDEAPQCLNYEEPTYGWWGAKVEDPNDDLNPHKGEVQNWEIWHNYEELWRGVPKQDQIFFENRDDKEICRHLDACGGISATSKDSGSVVFRLPKQEVGLVVICGCCGKTVAEPMFLNNTNIEISYNGRVLDRTTWDLFPNAKCARLMKTFDPNAATSSTGHNYLRIKALENLTEPVRISHVITL